MSIHAVRIGTMQLSAILIPTFFVLIMFYNVFHPLRIDCQYLLSQLNLAMFIMPSKKRTATHKINYFNNSSCRSFALIPYIAAKSAASHTRTIAIWTLIYNCFIWHGKYACELSSSMWRQKLVHFESLQLILQNYVII
jgi:hypothetical protein